MSEQIHDGGPAFPTGLHQTQLEGMENGISKRDYFAAKAGEPPADFMRLTIEDDKFGRMEDALEWRVRWSWAYADAMLRAREKGE